MMIRDGRQVPVNWAMAMVMKGLVFHPVEVVVRPVCPEATNG